MYWLLRNFQSYREKKLTITTYYKMSIEKEGSKIAMLLQIMIKKTFPVHHLIRCSSMCVFMVIMILQAWYTYPGYCCLDYKVWYHPHWHSETSLPSHAPSWAMICIVYDLMAWPICWYSFEKAWFISQSIFCSMDSMNEVHLLYTIWWFWPGCSWSCSFKKVLLNNI